MMKIKNTILLLVMMVLAPKAWALEKDGEGYFIIRTASDWNELADGINNGTITGAANARLYANIDGITKKIGYAWWDGQYIRGNSYYSGIFDGNGKTITVNLNGDDATVASDQSNGTHVAPFSHIKDATIKNICVKGTVRGKKHCSGLVSAAEGTNIITNAQISVDITATDEYCGGILGQGADSNTTISDCLFNGSITGGSTAVAGIWGWSGLDYSRVATGTIQNCLENGTYSNNTNFNPIAIRYELGSNRITATNCFYTRTKTKGNSYGTLATETMLADGTVTAALQNGRSEEIWVQDPVTNKPTLKQFRNRINISKEGNGSISWNINTAPNTSEETVTLTVTPDEGYFLKASDLKVRLSVNGGNADARRRTIPVHPVYETVTNNHDGTFTFTLPEKDYEYTANVTAVFKPVTVTLSTNSLTYNAAVQKPGLTVTFDGSTLTTNDYLAISSGESKDAGDYTITISGQGDYVGTTAAYPYTITPKEVGLTWSTPQTFEYDGTAKSLTATATGIESGDVCTVTVEYNAPSNITYTATAGAERINPDHRKEYLVDGNLSTKWTVTGAQRDNGIWWVEFYTSQTVCPIGYTLITGGDTQVLPSRNPKSWKLKARKTESDDWITIATVTNDNTLQQVNLTAYDFPLDVVGDSYKYYRFEVSDRHTEFTDETSNNDEMQLQDFHLIFPETPICVGTHTMTATALSNPNYVLPDVKTQSFTITPKEVSLTWTNTSLTYNGSAQKPTATAGDLITGDECTVTVSGEQTNANSGTATYTATASALSNNNYKLPDDITQSFTISPKTIGDGTATPTTDITLTGIDNSYVYTGSAIQPTVTLAYSQLPGENKTIAASGNYTVSYTDADHDNLNVAKGGIVTVTGTGNYTGNIVKTFTITQKPFDTSNYTISAIPNQTYNGTLLTPVVTLHDNTRNIDLTQGTDFSVTQHKDAGTHTVTIEALGNYQASLTADFTIDPKEVGLEWQETRSFVYDGTAKSLTATATGLIGDDVCTVTVVSNSVPYYGYTATAGHQRTEFNTLIGHLVDNDLTTKWCPEWGTNKSGVLYVEFHTNELIYPIGYTFYTGDDTSTYPSRNPRSWRLLAKKTENEAWTPISTVVDNYSLGFTNKTPYDFNLDVVGESYMYFRFEVSEHRDDKYDSFSSQHQLQLQDLHLNVPDNRNVGTHTMTATALSNSNYKLPVAISQTFEITQRPVTLMWTDTGLDEDTQLIYNGSAQKPTATAGNVVAGDECTVTVSGEQTNANTDATPTYTATAASLSNANYALPTETTQSYKIYPKTLTAAMITPDATTIDYTGNVLKPAVTIEDLVESSSIITVDDYTVGDGNTNPGSYTLTVTGIRNYTGTVPVDYKIVYPLTFGTKYVTFYSPFDLALPTGMTAYTVTDVNVGLNQVTLTEETSGIKANVPMILMGTASTDYKLEAAASVALNGAPHSQFVGGTTAVDCTAAGTIFILQTNGDAAEFLRAKTGTIPARKCYLDLSTAGARIRSLMVVIGDGTTSLRGLEENGERKEKREMWYSLDGRKLDGMPQKKGLYIHNGQKVVIK